AFTLLEQRILFGRNVTANFHAACIFCNFGCGPSHDNLLHSCSAHLRAAVSILTIGLISGRGRCMVNTPCVILWCQRQSKTLFQHGVGANLSPREGGCLSRLSWGSLPAGGDWLDERLAST